MKKSIFGNLRINNENNCPKKILHLNFDDVALGALDEQTARNYNQSITPGNLNSSVMNSFFGAGYALECQGIIDTEVASAAAFEAILENSLVTVVGPHGENITALYQQIKSKDLNPGANPWFSPSQAWVRVLRAAPGDVVPPAIDTMYISQWRKMQIPPAVTLENFLDYTDPSGVAFSCTILEAKTGGYAGVEAAGDYRFSVRIEEDVDGLYWSTRGDDFANNSAVPGVPNVVNRRFWREDTHTPIPPSDTWFFLEALIERGRATNRTLVQVTIAGIKYVICDKQSSGALISTTDAQEGIERLPWTRIFLDGLYSDSLPANYPLTTYAYDIQVWDSAPRFMGYIEMGNHGPLPWVPTPLSKATMFGASDGNDDNPGTEASPKTYQGAINAAVNPGDVVFFRGGTLALTTAAHFSLWNVGTAAQPIIYEVYPGEVFTIDGAGITPGVGNQRRVNYSDAFQKLRGVRIINMPEYGIYNSGLDNMVDGCEIAYCNLSGVSNTGSRLTIINSWIHHCSDVGKFGGNYNDGGNADGISFSSGTGGKILHNLITDCSDDLIDTWESLYTTVKYNICLRAGAGIGNGNGIKGGGGGVGAYAIIDHNLVAFCTGNGVDANTGIGVNMRNNTSAYNGGVGYVLEADTIHSGNVSIGDGSTHSGTGITGLRNSWEIAGTPVFLNIDPDSPDFLKVTQGDGFDGIGAHYI